MFLRIYFDIVKMRLFSPAVLLEEYKIRIRITYFTKKLWENVRILQIHPMRTLLINMVIARVKATILIVQYSHFLDVAPGQIIPSIWRVLPTNLYRKTYISCIFKFRTVRMSSHHRCTCEPICYHWA